MLDTLISKARPFTGAQPLHDIQDHQSQKQYANIDQEVIHEAFSNVIEEKKEGNITHTECHRKFARGLDILSEFPSYYKNTRIHNKTNTFGKNKKRKENARSKVCPCCGLSIQKVTYGMGLRTTPHNVWPDWLRECVGSSDTIQVNERTIRKKTFSLDPGIAMYFSFIKMVIFYFIFRFFIIDAYNLITNILSMSSSQIPFLIVVSTYYKSYGYFNFAFAVQDTLTIILVIFSIVYFNIYRWMLYRMENYNDFIEPDHFTILVENIPAILPENSQEISQNGRRQSTTPFNYKQIIKNYFTRKVVQSFFYCQEENKFEENEESNSKKIIKDFHTTLEIQREIGYDMNRQQINIVSSVSPCYNLEEIQNIQSLREDLMRLYEQKSEDERKLDKKTIKHIKLLNRRQLAYGQTLENHQIDWHLSHFTGKAFVTFQYAHFKNFILEDFNKCKGAEIENTFSESESSCIENYLKTKYYRNEPMPNYQRKYRYNLYENQLNIKPAQKPQEINWHYMKYSSETRKHLIFISFGYLILMLGTIFAILVAIQSFQLCIVKLSENHTINLFVKILSTILPTILIKGINFLVSAIVIRLTKQEKHENLAEYNVSLIIKMVIAQYVNTAFLYLLIGILMPSDEMVSEDGIINKITTIIISYGLIEIVTNILNMNYIVYIWRSLRVKLIEDKFQVSLNKELQIPAFDFTQRYAYYLLHTLIVSLYCTLSPITVPFLIIVFIVQYWIDKFNLFNNSSVFIGIDIQLSKIVFQVFQISILLYSIGNCLVLHIFRSDSGLNLLEILSLVISFVYIVIVMIIPKSWEKRLFLDEEKFITKYTYSACVQQQIFESTYWNENPLTKYLPEAGLTKASTIKSYNQQTLINSDDLEGERKVMTDFQEEVIEITSRNYINHMFQNILGLKKTHSNLIKVQEIISQKLLTNGQTTDTNGQTIDTIKYHLLCPNNHKLVRNTLWRNQLYAFCKICEKRIENRGEKQYCCRICNYDICNSCGQTHKDKLMDVNFKKEMIYSSNKITKTTTYRNDQTLSLEFKKNLTKTDHISEEADSPLMKHQRKLLIQSLIQRNLS